MAWWVAVPLAVLSFVPQLEKILEEMARNPSDVRFRGLYQLCLHFFGQPRSKSGSHLVFRTPWQGDPRINIQNFKGKAKEYQVRQVLKAIEKVTLERRCSD